MSVCKPAYNKANWICMEHQFLNNLIENTHLFYNILNIGYDIIFNLLIVYRNHKLRLITFAETHFNNQTITSFQEYLKTVPEGIIIYEDGKLVYFNHQLEDIISGISQATNSHEHIEQELSKICRPQLKRRSSIDKREVFENPVNGTRDLITKSINFTITLFEEINKMSNT